MQIYLILILILILILLWNSEPFTEPFTDSIPEKEKKEEKKEEPVWNPDLKKAWDTYYEFYSPFMKNWQSSIIQLQSTEKAPAEKKSPSDTTPPPTPTIPTVEEQNAYIEKLDAYSTFCRLFLF
jgi:deoxyribodipyrimidine photolyase